MSKELTPLMKQYWDIKSLHSDQILLFRMGDFFEMFYEDAVRAAPILGIALTQRNKKSQDETPMCGVPYHSIAGPINKLLAHGFKVAICDQVEDPKMAKGIVKRAVTRILTPGMVYDLDSLDGTKPHYLLALDLENISYVDPSTGECFYVPSVSPLHTLNKLQFLPVAELVLSAEQKQTLDLKKNYPQAVVSVYNLSKDVVLQGAERLPESAQRLLAYIQSLAGQESCQSLQPFVKKELEERLFLSANTIRHLEIFHNYQGELTGSLFETLNQTQTSGGARRLRQWINFPLQNQIEIEQRLDKVELWLHHLADLKAFRRSLSQMGDLERRLMKLSQPQVNARDLKALAISVQAALSAFQLPPVCTVLASDLTHRLCALVKKMEDTLVDEPPLTTRQGFMIQKGIDAHLDEWIHLSTDSHALLQAMEQRERERTGISSLKIRYNNVFGYYIEVTHTHKDKVPSDYQRKQTLAQAERYCTEELLELEKKVLAAQNQRFELEYQIFEKLKQEVQLQSADILMLAQQCNDWDVYSCLAWLSIQYQYTRPVFLSSGTSLSLLGSRHPVVEKKVRQQQERFVANDIIINAKQCLLITGPNMAGKSTLMRQVALTVVMAQMGSFIPANQGQLPLFDGIYTRIGASDQLSEGLSTFMVEMTETADMLRSATPQSLMILDEVGRGTSTQDGLALAQAILEHILTQIQSYTFFATHYHELTQMDLVWSNLKNMHMAVDDNGSTQDVRFLHTLAEGPALKSYGVHVAELAGLPQSIICRAQQLMLPLATVEHSAQNSLKKAILVQAQQLPLMDEVKHENDSLQKLHKILNEIKKYPLNDKTPLQAMNQISLWQRKI